MKDKIYAYHVSWYAKKDEYRVDGFSHYTNSVLIAPFHCYKYFVDRVRRDIAGQLNESDKVPAAIKYEADNIKLLSINYLGEYPGDMEEKS